MSQCRITREEDAVGGDDASDGEAGWSSRSSHRSHTASWVPSLRARYSDSVEKRETVVCRLDCQVIGPPARVKVYAPIDCLVSGQELQSASVYPVIVIGESAL